MRRILTILAMCLLMAGMSAPTAEANKTKIVKEAAKTVTKGAKNLINKGAKSKAQPKKTYTPKPRIRQREHYEQCQQCRGRGAVVVWNPYYGVYQNARCARCNGAGKIKTYTYLGH